MAIMLSKSHLTWLERTAVRLNEEFYAEPDEVDVFDFSARYGIDVDTMDLLLYLGDCKKSKADDYDPHTGCPSYPDCDLAPLGCRVQQGSKVEWYGHRD